MILERKLKNKCVEKWDFLLFETIVRENVGVGVDVGK